MCGQFSNIDRNDTETLEQQHDYCPKDGWCNFWKLRDNYDNEKRLPAVFYDVLQPAFQRLSKNDLLNQCLHGMTQNQNESIKGVQLKTVNLILVPIQMCSYSLIVV